MAFNFKSLFWNVLPKKIYGLIGAPGTGKSFRAFLLADKYNIHYVIDDGLLLKDQKILAGYSANEEKFHVSAIKRAIFTETKHAREVRKALQKEHFNSLLILCTSENMLKKIIQRLHLPKKYKVIKIEDIATKEEIQLAQKSRIKEGKHVIPIPVIEVKKKYPTLVLNAIHLFKKEKGKEKIIEKTIVRPNFNEEGKIQISPEALNQMIIFCIEEYSPDIKLLKNKLIHEDSLRYSMKLYVAADYQKTTPDILLRLRNTIKEKIENFTGLTISKIDIEIKKTIS